MKDLLVSIIILIIITIFNLIFEVDNKILEAFIALIPAAYPTYTIWRSNIKKNIKWMNVSRKDVNYKYTNSCYTSDIDEEKFISIRDRILNIRGSQCDKITTIFGENMYKFECRIFKSSFIMCKYRSDTNEFFLEYVGGKSYKFATRTIEKVIEELEEVFNMLRIDSNNSCIEIEFVGIENNPENNPFVTKFFSDFDDIKLNLKYKGKNNSNIEIKNSKIILKNSHISSLIKDLDSEFIIKNIKDYF